MDQASNPVIQQIVNICTNTINHGPVTYTHASLGVAHPAKASCLGIVSVAYGIAAQHDRVESESIEMMCRVEDDSCYQLLQKFPTDSAAFKEVLYEESAAVLVVGCHGAAADDDDGQPAALLLGKENGSRDGPITGADLSDALPQNSSSLECLILNACNSREVVVDYLEQCNTRAIRPVPYIVCWRGDVERTKCPTLLSSFFNRLKGHPHSYGSAFMAARSVVGDMLDLHWAERFKDAAPVVDKAWLAAGRLNNAWYSESELDETRSYRKPFNEKDWPAMAGEMEYAALESLGLGIRFVREDPKRNMSGGYMTETALESIYSAAGFGPVVIRHQSQ